MLKLNEELRQHGVHLSGQPGVVPVLAGRAGGSARSGWSLLGSRFGHTRDLVISFEIVLPTGEIIRVGDGGGKKIRKSSTGYHLKHLFMGHQGTLGIVTEATLELVPKPRGRVRGVLRVRRLPEGAPTVHQHRHLGHRHPRRRGAVRREEGRVPAPRRRGVHPACRRLGEFDRGDGALRHEGRGERRPAKMLMEKGRAEGGALHR